MATRTQLSSVFTLAMLTLMSLPSSGQAECNTPVGIADPSLLPDDRIVVSSEAPGHGKEFVRFNCCKGKIGSAWCPDENDPKPSLEIRLPKEVPVGKIEIQAPYTDKTSHDPLIFYPQNFLKSFDLSVKLKGVPGFVSLQKDMVAIANKTIPGVIWSFTPPVNTDVVRIEPREREGLACFRLEIISCEPKSLCSDNWCLHGGECSGPNTCNCTAVDGYYGERCEYTKSTIPSSSYKFVRVDSKLLITEKYNFTYHGQLTLERFGNTNSVVLHPASYIDIKGPQIATCLTDPDSCVSGFSISIVFSVTHLKKNETQIILSSLSLTQPSKGMVLYFHDDKVHCLVGTSSQLWAINSHFVLKDLKWYEMTISWSLGRGLLLLENGVVIGSSLRPTPREQVTLTQPLTIGFKERYTTSLIKVASMKTLLLFWTEAERVGFKREEIPTTIAPTTLPPTTTTAWPEPSCKAKLGMQSGAIKADQISASSSLAGHGTEKARAGCCQGEEDGGWCADPKDTNPWIQVDLDQVTAVSALTFQVPERVSSTVIPSNYFKRVRLEYRDVNSAKLVYKAYSSGMPATLNATVAYLIQLRPRVVTDSVRLYITDAQGMACFRFDLVGCPVTDLCPPNYCENGGQCSGDKKCTCDDDHYGARCQLDKTDIVTKDVGFKEKVNNTITTSDPNVNLTAAGDVTVIKSNSTDVIQLTNGGSVTFPDDECLKDLNKCTSGFTVTLVIDVLTIKDDRLVILTTTGGTPGSQGLTLIYDRLTQKVTFSVRTRHVAWTVTSLLKWQENTWYKMTVTWSPSSGCGLLVDGVLTGSVFGGTYVTTGGSSKPLCLGCGLVSTKVTSTVLIKLITTVHVYISDLTKANVIDVATTPAPPTTTAVSPAPACKTKLGMESGAIKTDQISASSSLPGHGTEKARAGCCKGEEDGGWCADPKDPNPWIQVDLDQVTAVSALSFQVPERVSPTVIPPNYVKRVRLEYRDASTNTTTYKAYSADFPATLNATLAYIIELRPKVVTDSVRIYVTDAHGVACIRFDLIGCDLQDVCPTNYCQNGGQCSGEKTCTCTDDHYGDRCQLDKTEITPQEIGFKDKVNNTITTTDPATNLTATGDVTVIKSNKTNVIEVTNGGYVTFPEDVCLRNLDKCTSGFTLTLVVNCVIIRDDKLLILTSGGEDKGSQGLTLVYNKLTHKLTFTVQTSSVTWKLTTGLKWLENTWYKLTVTWSPAAGCGLVVDGVLTGSVFGGVVTSSGTSSKPLCLGCSYVNTKITSTILIKIISTTHVYIKDLVKADVVDVTSTKDACSAALSDFKFESVTSEKSEVVTSLGTMKSHGDVSIRQEDKDVMLVLDQQGEYVEVSNTGFPCVDDITSCESDLTYRMTFRFLDFLVEPNFIMSSGGDLLNSTGISLYYFHGKINFWVKDGVMVWRAIYDQLLDLQRWYTIDATWSHKGGIELRLDGHLLTNTLNASHKAEPVTEKHPLHLAKSPGANKNKTSLMEILVFRVWRETMDKLQDYHCDELKIKNPVDKCFRNMVDVKFTEVERGHDLLTSLGTMKTYGDVTVEQTMYKQGEMVLVIDEDGEYVDMGTTGIPCLDDITSCNSSFNFRLTFIITKISTQPNYILSSGGELNNATGISLYYFDDKIYFWVKDGTMMHRKFLDRTLEENTWYTLDASWDSNTKKIDVYLDGQEVKGLQFPSSPTPSTMDKYSLLIAKSPEKPSSTRMNILLFRFWEETRTQLVKDGCEKILQVDNPPNPITTPAPTTTPSTTAQLPLHKTQVTFTTIVGNTLVTNYHNMTIHGSVYLEVVPAGNVLVLEKPGSFVDVGKTGIPCLDDIASCNTGFNFRLTCSLTSLTTNPQVLISSGGVGGGNGLTVRYFSQIIYVFVKTSRETYVGTFPCEMRPGFWYTLDVSWSVQTGLGLHVNNLLINGTNLVTSLGSSSTTANTLLLGKSPSGTTTTSLRVYEIDLWTRIYSKLPKQQIVLPSLLPYIITTPGPTTTPEEKLSTTPTALPATTPKHVTRAPINVTDYVWTLSKVTQTTVVSNKQELVVVGGPNHVVNGLILEKADQFLEIPHLKDTCITNPAKCNEGLTIEIDVKLLELAEETIIFTSGGERPDEPGVTLLYRYGYIHVIVSTGSQSWYVSVSRQKIWTNQFCKILVSWSVKTRLQIFVNNVLVGVSESPVPHKEITTSIQDSLIIGGGNTRCVIKEVHIWLVHVEILVETNIIIVQGTPGTPAPTTAASQTPAPTTAAPQTPAPTTTAPVPSVFTSSKPVPTSDFPQCPVGCVPAGPSTAVPSSPQPTTGAPAPTTPAPTQGQTSPPHLPTTNAPAPVPSKPAPTTPKPAPTTPKPAPTTPKPAPTTPKPAPTTPKPAPTTSKPAPTTPKPAPTTDAPAPTTPKTAPTTDAPAPTTPKPAPTTPKPAPTTPKPAPTTATPGPTTTTPKPTTTTPKPTTTTPKPTTTTTTPAPTTTTPLKCPDLPPSLSLTIEADVNGNAELICAMPSAPVNNIQVEFTWQIEGVSEKWTRVIEAPDVQARLPVSELDINLFNKRIVCKAQLSWMVPGAPDCPHYKISQVLIPTLTVTTTSQLVVIEGREPEVVQVRPTCPPSALCKPEDNGRCTVQITTVITTQRREIRCSRREIKPQAVLGVTDIKTGSSSSVCGVEVTKDNWQKPVTIPVKATIDKVIDRDQTRVIQVSIRVTGKITGTTETHEIGKVPVKAIDRDRRAQCSSVNDPHMKTFDGVRYNNFVPGEFVLFKHKTLPYEVRSRYQLCSSRRPTGATCNCGAAVRSGDDVIVFDACNRNSRRVTVIDVQMYKNGQLTPGTSIRKHGCGQKYEVFLPTGMKVTISRSRQPFINIYVTPSSPDFERSEGLCGNYNGNARDDLEGERSRAPTKWNIKWKRSDTYFRGVAAYPYPSPPVYCSCQSNQSPVCKAGLDVYLCTTRRISGLDITSILIRGARRPSLSNGRNTQRRHKRAVEDDPADVEEEEDMPTMTPEEAVQNCSDYLNASPLLGKCSSYIDSNATAESIRECAEDLEALGDPTWARSHLDHMLEECMENVQLEQEEEEEENNSTTTTPSPAQSLIQNLCVDDCGDHGDCVAGVCDCKDGWTGQTCDVSAKTRPEVYPAEEICDSVTSSCSDVKIDGNNFVQSPNLSCTFRYDDTPEKKRGEADLVSMYQVICREPESELKGRKARITISNDGEEESEESYLRVVYKSSCESCQLDSDGSKKCTPKTDICIIGDECYARNQVSEKDGCYFCNPDVSTSQWDRSSDPGCGPTVCPPPEATAQPVQAGNSDSDTDTVIIVLGVLCGVMSLVAMAATYTACKGRRKPQQKHVQLEEQSPKFDIHRRNVTDPTRHTYGNNAYDNDDNVEK